jgi:hypothetical protein
VIVLGFEPVERGLREDGLLLLLVRHDRKV